MLRQYLIELPKLLVYIKIKINNCMTNNNKNFYKKTFLISILIILGSVFLIKFTFNIVKNEVANILNSKKFDVFIFNQINSKIQLFANKKLTEEERFFYKENFKKIYINFKPILDDIGKDQK